jgi:alpha-D-ribose 1-methylphosphonate 5-triphosphate synthase subunit PhnG
LAANPSAPPGETLIQAERRVALLGALVKTARDPAAIGALKAKGELILNGEVASVEANLRPLALWAVAYTDGDKGLSRIQAAVDGSTDAEFRGTAIIATAGARGTDAMKRIGAWMLGDGLRTRERADLVRALFEDPDMRATAWNWMRGSLPAMLEKTPSGGRSNLIRATGDFCDAATRASVEETFKPRIAQMPGAPRVLANALERMNRCISLKVAKGDEVSGVLGRSAPQRGRPLGRRR